MSQEEKMVLMTQEQKFKRKDEEKTRDIIPVAIDKKFTRSMLQAGKLLLHQPKDSTALKQLARIGLNVIQDKKIADILDIYYNNDRRNKDRGIVEYD